MIGDDIMVTIVDIVGGRARLGVNAPPDIAVVKGDDPARQVITLGPDISVRVIDVRGDKVRIGIDVPRGMSVHRREIYEAIRREMPSTAEASPPPRNPVKPLQDAIATALVLKFSEAAEPLIDEIRQISDFGLLRRIAQAIDPARTLDDVRRALPG
jgi:carbon storage regulator